MRRGAWRKRSIDFPAPDIRKRGDGLDMLRKFSEALARLPAEFTLRSRLSFYKPAPLKRSDSRACAEVPRARIPHPLSAERTKRVATAAPQNGPTHNRTVSR